MDLTASLRSITVSNNECVSGSYTTNITRAFPIPIATECIRLIVERCLMSDKKPNIVIDIGQDCFCFSIQDKNIDFGKESVELYVSDDELSVLLDAVKPASEPKQQQTVPTHPKASAYHQNTIKQMYCLDNGIPKDRYEIVDSGDYTRDGIRVIDLILGNENEVFGISYQILPNKFIFLGRFEI